MTKLTGTELLNFVNENQRRMDKLDMIERAGYIKEDGNLDHLGFYNELAAARSKR
jgi:hypothetical protein